MQLNFQFETNDQGGYPYATYNKETQTANPINYNHKSIYQRDLYSTGLNMEFNGNGYRAEICYQPSIYG
jgi:iron complex outermembrane recepter protein